MALLPKASTLAASRIPPPDPPPARLPLSPWKLFVWGVLFGFLLSLGITWASPFVRKWHALENAKIEVEVRKILGACPSR